MLFVFSALYVAKKIKAVQFPEDWIQSLYHVCHIVMIQAIKITSAAALLLIILTALRLNELNAIFEKLVVLIVFLCHQEMITGAYCDLPHL